MLEVIVQIISYSVLIFVTLFVGIAFFNEILIFSFLLVDYSLKSLYKPHEYPRAPISLYIKNFWREFFYIMRRYLLVPYKWLDITVNKNIPSETVVLLVHGYCRNQTDWLWMRKQLKELNLPIYCINLQPMFAGIDEITKHSLIPKIAEIKAHTNCKNLILIGHSMGGLVSSYFSEYLDIADLVKAVITIGTPFYGTRISVVGNGENARQMCPGSDFLKDLHAKLQQTAKSYLQVASRFDNMIFPWQSAILEYSTPAQQFVLDFEAHLCMLRSKIVAQQLREWLTQLQKKIPV